MKSSIVKTALVGAALLLCANLSFAADGKPATATDIKPISVPKAGESKPKAGVTKAAKKVKLVDINSAGKAELKTLPGIGDAEADKIVAGRPYLSKADLVTGNVLPRGTYEKIKGLVIARQNKATAAKVKEKQQAH